jgi:hypothetical protein
MITWGAEKFGQPCRECGFDWDQTADEYIEIVAGIPFRFTALTQDATGTESIPELSWDVRDYTCHVADNLRNSSERLLGALETGDPHLSAYDPDELSVARRYESIALPAALWSLERSVDGWLEVATLAVSEDLVFEHVTRGRQTALDVVGGNAHDAFHHAWDLTRILG